MNTVTKWRRRVTHTNGHVNSQPFPVFSDAKIDALFYITAVLCIIGFLCCYFYCFTSLFRPVMLKFPNSNIFWMHFSGAIFCSAIFFPLLLGEEYTFCNSKIQEADQSNWACTVNGKTQKFETKTFK